MKKELNDYTTMTNKELAEISGGKKLSPYQMGKELGQTIRDAGILIGAGSIIFTTEPDPTDQSNTGAN